ncbi:helix-turn-helix domain-containing protein [Halobaculum sp. MBLA0147]|uniref:helix-turn-helix domain-containing protein n=1 Tax=Halobaculum sp. MBLA0147 TaxID=3079934 RepID=UPI003523FC68
MARDALSRRAQSETEPALDAVLDALDDDDCRVIIEHLEEPMTAAELSDATDIPSSTMYRKLDLLSEAALVDEGTEVRPDGHHASVYVTDFETVEVSLDDERSLTVDVERPSDRDADERLSAMWQEVRRET